MADNRKSRKTRKQIIYSEPRKILMNKYLTRKGRYLLESGQISKEEAWEKYGKNKYRKNPNAVPIREITHDTYHMRVK